MKKKEQRINLILEMIREQPSLTPKELARVLDVSEMTIRRDLSYLKSSGILSQSLGMFFIDSKGKSVSAVAPAIYDFRQELGRNTEVKERIARKAAELIIPRDIIILDSSTTVSMMLPFLSPNMSLTVMSNNDYILSRLPKDGSINLIAIGGTYNCQLQMYESNEGIAEIKSHRATKYFFSSSGVHEHLGLTCSYAFEVMTKRASIGSSVMKIFLSDSSKLGVIKNAYFAKLTECDVFITDSGITPEWKSVIEGLGITLYIV